MKELLIRPAPLRTLLVIFCLAGLAATTAQETFKTPSGDVYHNAVITELGPAFIAIQCDEGVLRLAPDKLPEHIQKKYGYLPPEKDVILEGIFSSQGGLGGTQIEFKAGQFDYINSGDASPRVDHFIGRYTVHGHWVVLHNPKIQEPILAMVIFKDTQVLMTARDYKLWKDKGEMIGLMSPIFKQAK